MLHFATTTSLYSLRCMLLRKAMLGGSQAFGAVSRPPTHVQELVREKDGELAAARAARRRALLPMVAAAANAAERRVSQEVHVTIW